MIVVRSLCDDGNKQPFSFSVPNGEKTPIDEINRRYKNAECEIKFAFRSTLKVRVHIYIVYVSVYVYVYAFQRT